jgi:hypothetical protein
MDNVQPAKTVSKNTDLLNSAAELAFSDFLKQMFKPDSKGFISEANYVKIFSFESYLRETGYAANIVQGYCDHIKSTKSAVAEKAPRLIKVSDYRSLAKICLTLMTPGIMLYLLVVAFLWTYDISLLHWVPFILFALSCPFMMALLLLFQYLRAIREEKSGVVKVQYIVKYFDDEELTYVKSKSRLFVEK